MPLLVSAWLLVFVADVVLDGLLLLSLGVVGRADGSRFNSGGMLVSGCAGGGIIGIAGAVTAGVGKGLLRGTGVCKGESIGCGTTFGKCIAAGGNAGGVAIGFGTAAGGSTIKVSRRKITPSSFCTVTVHVPAWLGERLLLEFTRQGFPVTGNCKPSWK